MHLLTLKCAITNSLSQQPQLSPTCENQQYGRASREHGSYRQGYVKFKDFSRTSRERSGSVVECLTRDRRAAGSSLTASLRCGPWARHIYPSLVLVQPRKTRPSLPERLLMGRKEPNQTNKSRTSKNLYFSFQGLQILWNILNYTLKFNFACKWYT